MGITSLSYDVSMVATLRFIRKKHIAEIMSNLYIENLNLIEFLLKVDFKRKISELDMN